MRIPTEPIGSIPRPRQLMEALKDFEQQRISREKLEAVCDEAVQDTLARFEATGSPIVTDGEQTKPSFATYPVHGLTNLAPDGVSIQFSDGHSRQLPRLTAAPFKYKTYAGHYLERAQKFTQMPLKQAVISASALSLIYPREGLDGYSREAFLDDLVSEAVSDIRSCFEHGAQMVQIDFTEGRLAVKLDPSKQLLQSFIELNNRVLSHFSAEQQQRLGFHTCPGGDLDSTHSADVDYAELLPSLFALNAQNFYMQLASETEPARILRLVKESIRPHQRVYVGVIDVLEPKVETPEQVCQRILQAAEFIPVAQLGTTDDCGFSPFGDDLSTARKTAFEKIRARILGTAMAADKLGL